MSTFTLCSNITLYYNLIVKQDTHTHTYIHTRTNPVIQAGHLIETNETPPQNQQKIHHYSNQTKIPSINASFSPSPPKTPFLLSVLFFFYHYSTKTKIDKSPFFTCAKQTTVILSTYSTILLPEEKSHNLYC